MQSNPSPGRTDLYVNDSVASKEATNSAVSWAPIIAGAFVMAVVTLMLITLGASLGFSMAPPPVNMSPRASAVTFTLVAALWLIIVQWLASALGGYLTGRLRTKWVGVHSHEVFFRDTAHGFLSWAVATAIFVGLLASTSAAMVKGSMHEANNMQSPSAEPLAYYIDNLYRTTDHATTPTDASTRDESARMLVTGMGNDTMSDNDKTYLAQLVAARTGLSLPDAEKRVDDVTTQMKSDAMKARKAMASFALFTFLSMLIGAFVASAAAAFGGHQRDEFHAMTLETR